MKRDTRQAYRRRAADTERLVDDSVAAVKAERLSDLEAAKRRGEARRAAMAAKPAVEAGSIEPGMWVLNRRGWAGEAVRVNRSTVTVSHMGSEMRWALDSIIAAMFPTTKETA